MRLEKYHGLGNDFLVLVDLDAARRVDPATVRAICDRHRGVGADGFIRVGRGSGGADVTMELWNADGGRAETSGNGLRCLARACVDAGLAVGPDLTVATDAGPVAATVGDDGVVSVEMGTAGAGPTIPDWVVACADDLPALKSTTLSMGNPHLVVLVDDVADVDLAQASRAVGRYFPDGVNVEMVAAGPGPDRLTMRVWERGVGETLACGSGACAVAVAGRDWGLVADRVTVAQPGGELAVDLSGASIVLTGPAEFVCTVEWPD